MGRPFTRLLDESTYIYICRFCSTHQAHLFDHVTYYDLLPDTDNNEIKGSIFRNVVNVYEPDGPRNVGPHSIQDLHCVQCNNHLGWRLVTVVSLGPNHIVPPGIFLIKMLELNLQYPDGVE